MLSALRKSFDRMEESRLRVLKLTETLSEMQAHTSPKPGEWSVVQVLEHTVNIELLVLRAVQQQLAKNKLRDASIGTSFRSLLLTLALRYRKKIKAPAILPEPTGNRTFKEWRREWEASRRQWQQLLENTPEKLLQKELFKHPLAGYLTLRQTLDFITEHTLHHVAQVKRLVQSV